MTPDLSTLLYASSEEEQKAKALALAAALRGQQAQGLLGQLSGDRVLSQVGTGLLHQVGEQREQGARQEERALTRALQAERDKVEAAYRASQETHQRNQEQIAEKSLTAQQRHQLAMEQQGRFSATPYGVVNNRTGDLEPYAPGAGPTLKPKEIEDQFKGLSDAVSTVKGRANLNAQNQARLYSSERVKAIALNPDGTARDLTPNMMTELAGASASLITNGSPAQHTIEQLTPKSVGSDWARIQQWLSDEPKGAGQQKFVQQMIDQASREEELISHQMRAGQRQGLPNFAHLRGVNKERFESILKGAGLDPAQIDERGLYVEPKQAVAPGGTAAPQANAALEWAKANPNDPRSAAILKKIGVTP